MLWIFQVVHCTFCQDQGGRDSVTETNVASGEEAADIHTLNFFLQSQTSQILRNQEEEIIINYPNKKKKNVLSKSLKRHKLPKLPFKGA